MNKSKTSGMLWPFSQKKHVQKHHKIYGFIQLTSDLIFSVYIEVWPFSNRIVNPF